MPWTVSCLVRRDGGWFRLHRTVKAEPLRSPAVLAALLEVGPTEAAAGWHVAEGEWRPFDLPGGAEPPPDWLAPSAPLGVAELANRLGKSPLTVMSEDPETIAGLPMTPEGQGVVRYGPDGVPGSVEHYCPRCNVETYTADGEGSPLPPHVCDGGE